MASTHLYCTACGAANQAQEAFCFACGRPLKATSSLQSPGPVSASSTQTGLLQTNHLLKQRYRILSKVGSGGFGTIYKAEDTQLGGRLVAVKEMSQDALKSKQEIEETAKGFEREALMLAALRQQNLPRIYDHFSDNGRWYLVMDFIDGQTLTDRLRTAPNGHLSVKETLQIGIQLCIVLNYLHMHQPAIIFRDLKPDNIMLTPDGHVYLIDFGIARFFKAGQAKDTIALGSTGYAAPEQYATKQTQTTPRADIYSLGATLHQMLSGNDPSYTPFNFAPLQLTGHPAYAQLSPLIMQMLSTDESKRPASMAVIKQQLEQIDAQLSGSLQLPAVRPIRERNLSPRRYREESAPFSIGLSARSLRTFVIYAVTLAIALELFFSMCSLVQNFIPKTSSTSLKASSTISVLAPTATPFPTMAPTPTPTPTPIPPTPTPTPAPKVGDTCQASPAWSGWNGTKDWKVNGGLLLNDGTYADNAQETIVAPCQVQTGDYAVELQMQKVSAFYTGTIYPCFYIMVRGTSSSNGWQGYAAVVCANLGHGPAIQIVKIDTTNNIFTVLSTTPFDPQGASHTYRVELKGTSLKFFIDGGLLLSADDSTYLNAGQIGLQSNYMQVKLSSFKIIML